MINLLEPNPNKSEWKLNESLQFAEVSAHRYESLWEVRRAFPSHRVGGVQ